MVRVDIDQLIPEALSSVLGEDLIEAILDNLAALARHQWILQAQRQLSSSKSDYIRGIQEITVRKKEREIVLVGWLPNAVEKGLDPFDLRKTLLGEGKGKVAKAGHRYRAIPFRHGTPGTEGEAGPVMGMRYGPQGASSLSWASGGLMEKAEAVALGKAVYRAAKALKGRKGLNTGQAKGRVQVQVPKLAPWHKTDIYAGMRKERHTYEKAVQSQYVTFRTISEKQPAGWIHPGILARGLIGQVENYVARIAPKAIEATVNRILGELGR